MGCLASARLRSFRLVFLFFLSFLAFVTFVRFAAKVISRRSKKLFGFDTISVRRGGVESSCKKVARKLSAILEGNSKKIRRKSVDRLVRDN